MEEEPIELVYEGIISSSERVHLIKFEEDVTASIPTNMSELIPSENIISVDPSIVYSQELEFYACN